MAMGKIKKWFGDQGFGFIEDDAGEEDAFLHISQFQGNAESLVEGVAIVFDRQPSQRKPGSFEAHNARLQETSSSTQRTTKSTPSSSEISEFHNPYTFVPSPRRQDAISTDGFAGDFNPLKCGLSHASLKSDLWTGHLPIKLTTVTPLVLLKTEGEKDSSDEHQTYDVLDHLPESSLRGMLRSAYEVVTNSRYGCFSNDDRLAYRMNPRKLLHSFQQLLKMEKDPKN